MSDVWHDWGTDLNLGPTGDLLLADDENLGGQRILRRLLTNPGGYIWALDYGGGLGLFVGEPADPAQIESVINCQMAFETYVDQMQPPITTVTSSALVDTGTVSVQIRYRTVSRKAAQVLEFNVPGSLS